MLRIKCYAALMVMFLLAGCAQEAPKCADPATLSLVREIIVEQLGADNAAAKLSKTDRDAKIQIQNPRAAGFDEKIKKYSCEGNLMISFRPAGEALQMPIKYESQLDDANKHLVVIQNIFKRDMFTLAMSFNREAELDAEQRKATLPVANVPAAAMSALPSTSVEARTPAAELKATADTVEKSGVCKGLDLVVTADNLDCISKRFALADAELNAVYKQLMGRLDEANKSSLRTQQRQWVKDKEAKCLAAGKEHEGGSMQPIVVGDCQIQMTETQLAVLKAYK